jgi:hypothetical protein
MRWSRILLVVAVTLKLVAFGLTVPAEAAPAWVDAHCKFTTPILKWKNSTTRPGYSTPAVNSFGAWLVTPTPVYLTLATTGANIVIADGNYGPGADGGSYVSCVAGYEVAAAQLFINRFYADAYPVAARQSVIVHEVGHALGLDHASAGTCPNMPIMQPLTIDRYTDCLLISPQIDDINGINALY